MVEAREGARELMPGGGSQDGLMSPARVKESHLALTDIDGSLSLDKVTVEGGGIALFKAAQMPG